MAPDSPRVLLARLVVARDALEDGDLALADDVLRELEADLAALADAWDRAGPPLRGLLGMVTAAG